ncbi:TPA: hypothetical protein QDZ28_000772 [Pseudomonas putida]|nr:hypothetical protein [Pseudomonas putida]
MGSMYFWLRSPMGLVLIAMMSILPTLAIATWLGNTSDFLALLVGIGIAALRQLAWMRWGDGSD